MPHKSKHFQSHQNRKLHKFGIGRGKMQSFKENRTT